MDKWITILATILVILLVYCNFYPTDTNQKSNIRSITIIGIIIFATILMIR